MKIREQYSPPDIDSNIRSYSQADALYKAGRFRQALRLFKEAFESDPSDSDVAHAMGNCYDAMGQPARAAQAFQYALAIADGDKHPALHFNLGNAFYDMGQFANALTHYQLVPKGCEFWPAAKRNSELALGHLNELDPSL